MHLKVIIYLLSLLRERQTPHPSPFGDTFPSRGRLFLYPTRNRVASVVLLCSYINSKAVRLSHNSSLLIPNSKTSGLYLGAVIYLTSDDIKPTGMEQKKAAYAKRISG